MSKWRERDGYQNDEFEAGGDKMTAASTTPIPAPTPGAVVIPTASRKLTVGNTIPLHDATTEDEFKTYFLFNRERFPHARFRQWLEGQRPCIRRIVQICPPTRLYRIVNDGRLAAIAGYKGDSEVDARIVVVIFGDESSQFVDPTQLKDATAELPKDGLGATVPGL